MIRLSFYCSMEDLTREMDYVHLLSNTVLKPSRPSSDVLVPLTIFNLAMADLHIGVLRAFHPTMSSNAAMKDGRSNAINHFPHLAGPLLFGPQLGPCIRWNGAGVWPVETRLSTPLSDWLSSFALSSLPEAGCLAPETAGSEELIHIHVNRFACGGMANGVAGHHRVADGPSMRIF